MAFVHRAPRTLTTIAQTSTPDDIGPGYYIQPNAPRPDQHSYAPFNSTTERSRLGSTQFTPAPGSYGAQQPESPRQAAAAAFRSRVDRLASVTATSVAPGPGQYNTRPNWVKDTSRLPPEPQARTVAFNRSKSAPSVPAPHQSHGYEETKEGQLVPQKPKREVAKELPGPADYQPEFANVAKPARKADFAHSAPRPDFFAKDAMTPGPGAYTADEAAKKAGKGRRRGRTAPFGSRVPLPCYKPVYEDELDQPGPGSYDISALSARRAKPAQTGFSTGVRSNASRANAAGEMPGPGAYEAGLVRGRGGAGGADAPAPFATTAGRFLKRHDPTEAIGPGMYEKAARGFAEEIAQRRGGGGMFGSNAERFVGLAPMQQPSVLSVAPDAGPGPGSYELEPQAGPNLARLTRKETASFASASDRFHANAVKDGPAPGMYNVRPDWDRDRQRGFSTATNVFLSADRRFKGALPKDVVLGPGPGAYDVSSSKARSTSPTRGIKLGTTSARFATAAVASGAAAFLPGPGAYELRRELVKPSFNVTLDDAMPHA